MKTYLTSSSEQTKKLGERFAKELVGKNMKAKKASVFGLKGDLGAGKTTFVQGFWKGLGLKKRPQSPTFIIMRRHAVKHKRFSNVFHIDAYRLKGSADLGPLGLKEVFAEPGNIILIEWAERVKKILPKDTIWLSFARGKGEHERSIIIKRPK